MDIRPEHDAAGHRFVLYADGDSAVISEYFDIDRRRNFFRTVTLGQYRGRGLAAVLTEYALDDTRRKGLSVVPSCWFVREFIETNAAAYGDLLTSAEPHV
ncbi:GNAT family N-acetyltransferase [Rhodococcus sp. P1Y]|uniref:GNAT family N-acetyltransferase n=1 Tax=Rhodococcus sp. P1Y TaxID=1302308 RepID=UPI000EB541A5|nr:GNAT family N-acetyltransferase [Rhodococcus sp. P1Y]AYJ50727.1 N-acetyltransferase [Rhodococcus sp. P1Y]